LYYKSLGHDLTMYIYSKIEQEIERSPYRNKIVDNSLILLRTLKKDVPLDSDDQSRLAVLDPPDERDEEEMRSTRSDARRNYLIILLLADYGYNLIVNSENY